MKDPRISLRTYLTALAILSISLAVVGYDSPDRATTGSMLPADDTQALPDLSGSWTGSWSDTIYLVGGGVICTITIEGTTWSAVGQIDLTELGLGWQEGTATGTVTDDELIFTFTGASVGFGGGSLTSLIGTGSGMVTAPLNFGEFTFTGDAGVGEITGDFDFTGPGGGEGVVLLTPGVANEDLSWGDVKAVYR